MQVLTHTGWAGFDSATRISRKKIIELVKDSGLTGRSGSGFPTGLKWESLAGGRGEKYLICNADEGEPGTFKDKFILDHNPSLLIEGIAIAAYSMNIAKAYIYLRGEYSYLRPKLEREIKRAAGHLKKINLKIQVVLGAGSYLCGEESAILESIEGNRPLVRKKPPYPTQCGLYGKPTCVNNVETLSYIPLIILGRWDSTLNLFSLSGDLNKPGVYEVPSGKTLEEIVALGEPTQKPKAIYFGASGGCLPYGRFKNKPLDDKSVCAAGAMLGARSLIVVGERWNIAEISKVLSEFFVHEGCGYCTPCREGNFRLLEILNRMCNGGGIPEDLPLLEKLAPHIRDTSACALGKSSTAHLLCGLRYFRDDFVGRTIGNKKSTKSVKSFVCGGCAKS